MNFERLENIYTLRNGYVFKSEQFVEDEVPIIRISDINGNFVKSEKAPRTTFQKSISIITVKTNLIFPLYLKIYLRLNRKIFNKTSTGSAMTNLLLSQIRAFDIQLPPIELQTRFASIVTKTETLKEKYKNNLAELENLYGSLSQRAFKGELKFNKH